MTEATVPDSRTPRTVAVDLRALVPEATGIGVYTRGLLAASLAHGRYAYRGLSHKPVRDPEALAALGVSPLDSDSRLPLGVLWQQVELPAKLRALAETGGADLFWSPLMTLPAFGPEPSLPSVVTVHDLTVLLYPETHRAKVRLSLMPFLERSLARATRIVAVSEATARDVRFHFPDHAGKVRVAGEGVDPSYRPGAPDDVAALHDELGTPHGYILYVGALEPRKNVPTLVTAWESCKAEDDDFPALVLAGDDGWRNRSLRRRLERLAPHGVHHLGRVSQERLLRLYQGARVFAYPSHYEGFGLPPLEAMACGVPVVVSNVSSLPEVVGDAGIQVPPAGVRGLIDALKKVVGDPTLASDLAARGRERAKRFTWDRAARELEEVFDEAVG